MKREDLFMHAFRAFGLAGIHPNRRFGCHWSFRGRVKQNERRPKLPKVQLTNSASAMNNWTLNWFATLRLETAIARIEGYLRAKPNHKNTWRNDGKEPKGIKEIVLAVAYVGVKALQANQDGQG